MAELFYGLAVSVGAFHLDQHSDRRRKGSVNRAG
jgi:hypothetical protein